MPDDRDSINKAIKLFDRLEPLSSSSEHGQEFLANKPERCTTPEEHFLNSDKVKNLCGEYEPFILTEDMYNEGNFNAHWITEVARSEDRFFFDTQSGIIALKKDTLIYWK